MDKNWTKTLITLVAVASTACNTTIDSVIQAQPSTSSGVNHVMKVSALKAWDNLVQERTGMANTKYTVSFRLKGAGEIILRIFEGSWGTSLLVQSFQASSDWKTFSVPVQLGSNPKFTFNLTNSSPASTPAFIDDAKLTDMQGRNVLQNSDFEAVKLEPWWSDSSFSLVPETVAPPPPPSTGSYAWKNVEVGGGGMVTGIALHPKVQNLVYVRTDVGGVFRWNEATGSWIPLSDGFDKTQAGYFDTEAIAIDPQDPKVVFIAAGNGKTTSSEQSAILKSSDQGASWKVLKTDINIYGNGDLRSSGERLAVDPNNSSVVYFGSREQGLWRSTDGGTTWAQITGLPNGAAPQGVGWVAFDPTSGSSGTSSKRLWVGIAKEGVFQSDDAGATWKNILKNDTTGYYMGDVSVTSRGTMYVSFLKPQHPEPTNIWVDDGNTKNGLYKFENGVWTNISPDQFTNFDGVSAITVGGKDRILVTPWFGSHEWRGGFSSEDGAATWARIDFNDGDVLGKEGWITTEFQAFSQGAMLDPFNPDRAWALGGFGVWRTDNVRARDLSGKSSAKWTTQSRGIAETVDVTAKSLPNGRLITGISDLSGFVYTDLDALPDERSRHQSPIFTTTSIDALSSDPNYLISVGQDQNTWYNPDRVFAGFSTNGGYDWQRFPSIPETASGSARVGRVALGLNDKNNIVWAQAGAGVYATLDGGVTWKKGVIEGTTDSFDPMYYFNGPFSSTYLNGEPLAADKVNPKTFYVYGNINGWQDIVYRSTDGGLTWKTSNPFNDGAWEGGFQVRTMPGKAGEVWLARGDRGLWRSSDGTVSFTKFAGVGKAQGIAFGKSAPGRINPTVFMAGVVNNREGIWRSDDEGANWLRISSEKQNVLTGKFFNIEADVNVFGRVYIVTGGRGTFYGQLN